MTAKEKYESVISALRRKLHKGNGINNREEGFNQGILCAMSMIKAEYDPSSPSYRVVEK